MAVVEQLIQGADGYTRAANIRYSGGTTNRPIAKLYPLEVLSTNEVAETEKSTKTTATSDVLTDNSTRESHPTRSSATKARQNIAEWSRMLLSPALEDVKD